jgi:hypothetical protein
MLCEQGKFFLNRLRPTFYNFILTFPELTFHVFLPAEHKKLRYPGKMIENKNSIELYIGSCFIRPYPVLIKKSIAL